MKTKANPLKFMRAAIAATKRLARPAARKSVPIAPLGERARVRGSRRPAVDQCPYRILRLTLYRCWFDRIASGEKRLEFRDATPYWNPRLLDRQYDEVWFRNGYSNKAPLMRVEWQGCDRKEVKGKPTFVIKLGRVLAVQHRHVQALLFPPPGESEL